MFPPQSTPWNSFSSLLFIAAAVEFCLRAQTSLRRNEGSGANGSCGKQLVSNVCFSQQWGTPRGRRLHTGRCNKRRNHETNERKARADNSSAICGIPHQFYQHVASICLWNVTGKAAAAKKNKKSKLFKDGGATSDYAASSTSSWEQILTHFKQDFTALNL